jgi:hypothetical protein
MTKVRIAAFSVSIDGFGAGPRQELQDPLGVRGLELHAWFQQTEAFKKVHGQSGGTTGIDEESPSSVSTCSLARSTKCTWPCRTSC